MLSPIRYGLIQISMSRPEVLTGGIFMIGLPCTDADGMYNAQVCWFFQWEPSSWFLHVSINFRSFFWGPISAPKQGICLKHGETEIQCLIWMIPAWSHHVPMISSKSIATSTGSPRGFEWKELSPMLFTIYIYSCCCVCVNVCNVCIYIYAHTYRMHIMYINAM